MTFEGTQEKWESLSLEEKSKYDYVILRPEMTPIGVVSTALAIDSDVDDVPPIGGFHDW